MKTFIADIIPKIQRYSRKLDDLTLITNQHWISVGDIADFRQVFIFRGNNQLLISTNGSVERASWEYLGNQSFLIETKGEYYMLKSGFLDESVLALKLDGTEQYAFFVNESKHPKDFHSLQDVLEFLASKYFQADVIDRHGIAASDSSLSYEILSETEKYEWGWGDFREFQVKFSDGRRGCVYKGRNSGRFFYFDVTTGKQYCETFIDAINSLYRHLLTQRP